MTERLKLRHKATGEEKGPYWGLLDANSWVKLFSTGEYDFIRSSDCYDKHGNEIFEGDMVSYMDGWPVHIVNVNGRVGYFDDGRLVDVTPQWSGYAEIVGREGVLFKWQLLPAPLPHQTCRTPWRWALLFGRHKDRPRPGRS